MPAKAGIYGFCLSHQRKPWIPAFAGMTTCAAPVGQSFGYPVLRQPDSFQLISSNLAGSAGSRRMLS